MKPIVFQLDYSTDFLIPDEATKSLSFDPSWIRAAFNFRDQTKIYEKAEAVLRKRTRSLGSLKSSLSVVKADANFLENLMNSFDGEAVKAETN